MVHSVIIREIKNARDSEEPVASMEQVFAVLGAGKHASPTFLDLLFGTVKHDTFFCFEIASFGGMIHFYIAAPELLMSYAESQLTAQYPKLALLPVDDAMGKLFSIPHASGQLVLNDAFYLPLKTYADVRDIDLLAGPLGQLAKIPEDQAALVQLWVAPAGTSWQKTAASVVARGIPDPTIPGKTKSHPKARLIEKKISQTGFTSAIRIVSAARTEEDARRMLHGIAGSYGVFAIGEGNALVLQEDKGGARKKLEEAIYYRTDAALPKFQVMGSSELATLWHPPGILVSAIKNISWGTKLIGEPPENLPIATSNEEEKKEINFFARTEYKNKQVTFGIKDADRRKHMYLVGKTGTGKSTMIANMVVNDMRNSQGVAVIDPHGDLVNVLMDFVPSFRINDLCYLDPSDPEYSFHLNPLEVDNEAQREIVASGIVSIFYKLYSHSWGPRLEYILRNTILTLLYVPQATLLQVPEILTNDKYRQRVLEKLPDQVLKNFWINEFNRMEPRLRSEAIMPILNKVGQFLSSQTIRNIVGHPTSTVNLKTMMDEGKIILMNLSQGKLGEDNSALLGAMMITKIQLAAMSRVYQEEGARRDFYLYVDEFQNFATNSFIKILSEARKYRLNLMLANQYIGQIDEGVQNAIFGNAGSIVSFAVGATDARPLAREFGLKYKEEELVGLGNYQIVLKLSIDNKTSSPFSATTLPLPRSHNQNREKIIRSSRERFYKKV